MLEAKLLALLAHKKLTRRELAERLRLHGGQRKQLTALLRKLVADGALVEQKGRYKLVRQRRAMTGTFSLTEQGYGFLRPDDDQQEDLFVPARYVGAAMNGDRVAVLPLGQDRSGRLFGRVQKVLQRAYTEILGIFHRQRSQTWVKPVQAGLPEVFYVQKSDSMSATSGQVVTLELLRYPSATAAGSGRVVEILGDQDDPQVDIEVVIRSHNLPKTFPPEVAQEAAQLTAIDLEDWTDRVDLRDLPLMTIDGETARDFDDAVCLRRDAPDRYRLWVAIADVAHYVNTGSALDHAACQRGTSVYFPGYCLPMLPEALSNDLCSLRPDEDRLAMVAELAFNAQGQRLEAAFYPAVIRSRARLTYTQVAAFFDDANSSDLLSEIAGQLPVMGQLAEKLGTMRQQRGSLELDVPDVQIVLDDSGFPTGVVKVERNLAHRLIEEFMLAANEAVAEFLERRNYNFLYRVHEPPDFEKLQDFQQLAAECGIGMTLGKNVQRELQHLLEEVAERPEARLLNQQLLRSLQQARYSPENKGHFGLAADTYCHFTSPIRRYPDLTIHRVLKQALSQARAELPTPGKALLELGQDCSNKERRAMAAERDLFELRRCQLMTGKIGERFSGTIVSVTEFGFFVELDDLFVEGLVHVRSLQGDYYVFDPARHTLTGERKRRVFRVGMRVKVQLAKIDLWRRRLDFELVE